MLNLKRNRIAAANGAPERPVLAASPRERNRDEIRPELYGTDRSNFAARVIHDVCIPLTAVQGYCGLLLSGQLGPLNPDQTQALELMQRGLGKLWKSVETIDGLGQPAQMSTRLKLGNAVFQQCLQQAVSEVLPVLEKKEISLKLEIEPPNGRLRLDSQKIEQVLVNLLENSCKSSPRGSSITVRARTVAAEDLSKEDLSKTGLPVTLAESQETYRVDIIDSGSQADPDDIRKMFDEDASCGDPTGRAGSGLGLSICRLIVLAHKGHIWSCANSPGHGTTFSLLLPLAEAILESRRSRIAV